LLPVVKKAENMVVNDTSCHNYLSPTGIEGFAKSASKLLLGDIEKQWKDGMVKTLTVIIIIKLHLSPIPYNFCPTILFKFI